MGFWGFGVLGFWIFGCKFNFWYFSGRILTCLILCYLILHRIYSEQCLEASFLSWIANYDDSITFTCQIAWSIKSLSFSSCSFIFQRNIFDTRWPDIRINSTSIFRSKKLLSKSLVNNLATSPCCSNNNLCVMYALARLPISKTVLILSLKPIGTSVIAFVFLRERITVLKILCMIGGSIGIYIITLSSQDSEKDESIFGYLAAIACIWLGGATPVLYQSLNSHGVHASTVGFLTGITFIIQPPVASLFIKNLLNFEKYTPYDLLMNASHGFLCAFMFLFIFCVTKYMKASSFAPILNLENIFSVLFDVFLFQYHFTLLDIIGMTILAICIAIPILKNIYNP
ncbi:unnamed protein product [Moneuplotes crassus]|uniref:EamA domain-containing protein n=1 Tax=Euplotes crassus TaxID=5936 RepID=A0AAD1XAL3_EUPCR|nr:unnamed protein product [Moneuplotes crassus]